MQTNSNHSSHHSLRQTRLTNHHRVHQPSSNSRPSSWHPKVNNKASNLSQGTNQEIQDHQDLLDWEQQPTWQLRTNPILSLHCPQH